MFILICFFFHYSIRSDSISTDQDDFIDLTKCIGDEILLDDDDDDTSISNEETKCKW